MTDSELIELFRTKITNKSEEIDPNDERDWYDLAFGFFLALIDDQEKCRKLAYECCIL